MPERVTEELKHKADQSKNTFTKWMKSPSSTTTASYVATQEIVKRGKPFTDGEYIIQCFIKVSEKLYSDLKNKNEIVQKLETCHCL